MTQLTEKQEDEVKAYYRGRNSIDDDGHAWFDCPFADPDLITEFKRGQRHMRSEVRLNADTEWD